MRRTLASATLLLLASIALVAGIERYDALYREHRLARDLSQQLEPFQRALQTRLDALIAENTRLAEQIAADPSLAEPALEAIAGEILARQPRARSVVVTRKLHVVFVHPRAGNEPLIDLDFGMHPEFMGAITRAIASGATVIDAPVRLLQTYRPGLIVRTPIVAPDGELVGLASMAADLEGLLIEVGVLEPSLTFTPVIRHRTAGQPERTLFGADEVAARVGAALTISLPDGDWVLQAVPKDATGHDQVRSGQTRSAWIRDIGALITLSLLVMLLHRRGLTGVGTPSAGARGIALRTLMLLAVLILIPLLVGTAGWLTYRASMQVALRMEQQQTAELGRLIQDKVTAFFDVPRQVDTFNAELFRQGVLEPGRPDAILNAFLAQFRQQPLLTFLSMGNAEGEYYAASRPPLGDDRALRILRATIVEDRTMKLFRIDDANRPTTLISLGTRDYDARQRHWYQAAVAADSLKWYPAYRYAVNGDQGQYDSLGIGMSAPLYDPYRNFLGVVTADVALSQLGDFLRKQLADLGGTAFIAETDGNLLATSGEEPIYRLNGPDTLRIRADQSDHPGVRAAGVVIRDSGAASGNGLIEVEKRRYLLDWQSVQLPDGPSLTLALALPESRFAGPAHQALRDIAYLAPAFLIAGLLVALLFAYWFVQPLLTLERWARQLGGGQFQATPPIASRIREIAGLTLSLGAMAEHLRRHAEELEQRVAERTEALAVANQQLAELAVTDGLTGIANRRRFDETLAAECARAARSGQPLALLLVDVDWFKRYNDHLGHQAGDEALKRVAAVLQRNARRPGDLAARYGGEEFAVIAADTAPAAALRMAESIRAEIEALGLPHPGAAGGRVTVSIGVAISGAHTPADPSALVGLADAALYRAKAAGRNRVEIAPVETAASALA
jgi:diguanylate cyclase (GGDEF)-like protein